MEKIYTKQNYIDAITDLIANGMPEGLYLNQPSLDKLFRLDLGMTAVFTGIPNHGKSEVIDFINVRLNKLYGYKTLYFSPENPIKLHLSKLVSKVTENKFESLSNEEIINATNYIADNFLIVNTNNVTTIDDILGVAEDAIINDNIKIITIDPWNRIEWQRPNNLTETEYVGVIMDILSKFAKQHNVLIELVVHPKKMQRGSDNLMQIPTLYDLNGSANFANMADYVVVVHRDFINNYTIIKAEKVKFKNYGQIGECYLQYNTETGNYEEIDLPVLDEVFNEKKEEAKKEIAKKIYAKQNEIKEAERHNVLDVDISFFENNKQKEGKTINLYEYLTDRNNEYKSKYGQIIDKIRQAKTEGEKKKLKAELNVPCATISCLTGKDKSEIIGYNSLICIDIDKQDNTRSIADIYKDICKLKYVAYAGKSVSGKGIFCIIPISSDKDKFKQHFLALKEEFEQMGIVVDKNCSNINRLRYYSYDDNKYINPNANLYSKTKEIEINVSKTFNNEIGKDENEKTIIKIINILQANKDKIKNNKNLDITYSYNNWYRIGAAIANTFGQDGFKYFNAISELSTKYNLYECKDKYDELLCNPVSDISFATLIHYFNEKFSFV